MFHNLFPHSSPLDVYKQSPKEEKKEREREREIEEEKWTGTQDICQGKAV